MNIRHGHYLGYVHDGCRCDRCIQAWSVYSKRAKLLRLRGEQRLVDPTPAIEHARQMEQRWGVCPRQILQVSGIDKSAAQRLLNGDQQRMDRDQRTQVLDATIEDVDPGAWMDVTHLVAMVDRLLGRTGLSRAELARQAGIPKHRLYKLGQRDQVTVGTYLALARYEQELDRPRCEECGAEPFAGGRWCYDCFKARAKPVRPTGCGTDAGHRAHYRRGQKPCQRCRDAHNRLQQDRSAA